jgi:hypothetical protein
MGQNYGFIGRVDIPEAKLEAYREQEIDPSTLRSWLDGWEPDEPDDADYSLSPEDVFSECPEFEVDWRDDGFDLQGVVSDDSDAWLTYRITLVAIFRLAGKFGGSSELIIADAGGGDDEAWRAGSSADGKSYFNELSGDDADAALAEVGELDAD